MKNNIIKLKKREAIDFILGLSASYVLFKRGVWNKYEQKYIGYVVEQIKESGYGADVSEENGIYYVCCPVSSDMY